MKLINLLRFAKYYKRNLQVILKTLESRVKVKNMGLHSCCNIGIGEKPPHFLACKRKSNITDKTTRGASVLQTFNL